MRTALSRLFAAACVSLIAASTAAQAQIVIGTGPEGTPIEFQKPRSGVLLGPTIGGNRNYHTGGFRTLSEDIKCPLFESGGGLGYSGGITAEYVKGNWSLISRITYQSRPGSFEQKLPDIPVFIPDEGITVKQEVTAKSSVDYRIANAEVMFKHDIAIINNEIFVGLSAGPSVAYVLDGRITQYQDLDRPLNARFIDPQKEGVTLNENGRRITYADNEEIPGRQSLRFSLKAGLQVEVGLFDNAIMMSPGVYYDYGLSNVTNNENWDLNSIMFQVDFRHAL